MKSNRIVIIVLISSLISISMSNSFLYGFGGDAHICIPSKALTLFNTPELINYGSTINLWSYNGDYKNYTDLGCLIPLIPVGTWGWCEEPEVAARDHFWNVESNLGFGGIYPTANEKAHFYWNLAITSYISNNKDDAFKYLGMVVHLLSDMGSPAHVHNDEHFFTGSDYLENFVTNTVCQNVGNNMDVSEIPPFTSLHDLMYNLNIRAAYFPSNSEDGIEQSENHKGWPLEDNMTWPSILKGDLNTSENLNKISQIVVPLTIHYVARLYELFLIQAQDGGSDFPSAKTISIGSLSGGYIDVTGNRDFFEFTVTTPGTYVMYTRGSHNMSLIGTLYDQNYQLITSNVGGGELDNFRIAHTLNTGTYYVEVRVYSGTQQTGNYAFHLEGPPDKGTISDDHGFSAWSATPVSVGSFKDGVINVNGDLDYFSFTVTTPGTYVMYTRGDHNMSLIGTLYDQNYNQPIASNVGGGELDNFRIAHTLNTGTYYVEVRVYSGTQQTGNYAFHLEGPPLDEIPPTPNPLTFSVSPYAINSTSIGMTATTATDAGSPPVSYYFDFVDSPTSGTGGTDSAWQSGTSYTNSGLQPNHRYGYRVKARDSASTPNETGYSSTVYKYTLASAPVSAAFSGVTQTAIQANWTANGNRSGTEYYCENTTKGTNSGWVTTLNWNETSLTCGTTYSFRVKGRNGDLIETGWTSLGSQATSACSSTPPTPNPMTFAVPPAAASSTSISMTASTATDADNPPVSYFFDFVDSTTGGSGGADSAWQSGTGYTNNGLQPNHRYGYRVKARDSAATPAETAYSATVYKYTLANAPVSAAFSGVTQTAIQANWTANGNRTGTEYYVENTTKATNSGWITALLWNETGLTAGTSYTYRVKARNGDLIDTGWTSLGSQKTQDCPVPGTPSSPSPANGTTGISTSPTLTWAGTTNTDSYDIYFGTAASPPFVINTTSTSYNPTGLIGGTLYYWKIVAKNSCGQSTAGPVWSFTTQAVSGVTIPFTVLLNGNPFDDLELGWKANASDNFDNGIDVLAPPATVDGDDAYFLSITGQTTPLDKLRKDFRAVTLDPKTWKLLLKVANGKTLKLQWNPQTLIAGWTFTLQEVNSNWVGIGPLVNLNSSPPEITLANQTGDLLTRRYLVRASQGFPLSLKAGGWNLISSPLEPIDPLPAALFGTNLLAIYEWDAAGKRYLVPTALQSKKGYWVAVNQDASLEIIGAPPSSSSVHLLTGWNLVGPVETVPCPTGPPVLAVYGWGWPPNYQYVIPTQCEEGKGYWIAASQEGDVW
jgi:hypothetical protein